jgi:hypothetical protein
MAPSFPESGRRRARVGLGTHFAASEMPKRARTSGRLSVRKRTHSRNYRNLRSSAAPRVGDP